MPLRLHILCDGMETLNGQAFCYPLLKHRKSLQKAGVKIRLFTDMTSAFKSGDILALDRKFCSNIENWDDSHTASVFEDLRDTDKTLWFVDDGDSSGVLWPNVLSKVDLYIKNQLVRDKEQYLRPLHDERPYTDYYAKQADLEYGSPNRLSSVHDPEHLEKLALGWNSGLSDHAPRGRKRLKLAKSLLHLLPQSLAGLSLLAPHALASPSVQRPIGLHHRMKLDYISPLLEYQRRSIVDRLPQPEATVKLGRKRYFHELLKTWAVLSPFGYGEITLKDFEAFLCGNVLIKPDMSHLETWPPLYEAWVTYVPIRWDLSDLEERLQNVDQNREKYLPIAVAGQQRYLEYLSGPNAGALFADHFKTLVDRALASHRAHKSDGFPV